MPNYTSRRPACSSAPLHWTACSSRPSRVAERRVLDAAIGEKGRHVAGRRHVEGRVERAGLRGGDGPTGHALHLVEGPLLDRDTRAIPELGVDGGGRGGAVE